MREHKHTHTHKHNTHKHTHTHTHTPGINLVTGHHRSFDQFEENIIGHFHKTMSHNVKKGEKKEIQLERNINCFV